MVYYIYGREVSREPWSHTIPWVTLDVEKTNNLVNFHILFEVGFPTGRIRPYVQGLFGCEYLYTQTSVSGEYNRKPLQVLQTMMIGHGVMAQVVAF